MDSESEADDAILGDSEEEDIVPEEDDEEVGGYEKKEYYGADAIETEAQAKAAEEEAKRLQQKNLQKMSAADFGFDEEEWLDTDKKAELEKSDVVIEALAVQQITTDMSAEERMAIMQTRYPEYDLLADEALRLQPIFTELQDQLTVEKSQTVVIPASSKSTTLVKCRALGAYLSCLAMYFAILASPLRDSESSQPLDPAELRDHPIIGSMYSSMCVKGYFNKY